MSSESTVVTVKPDEIIDSPANGSKGGKVAAVGKTALGVATLAATAYVNPEAAVAQVISGKTDIDPKLICQALSFCYDKIKKSKSKDEVIDIIAEDVVQTSNMNTQVVPATYSAALQTIGKNNKSVLDSAITKKAETKLLPAPLTAPSKTSTEKKVTGGIDASSSTAASNVSIQEVDVRVSKLLDERLGAHTKEIKELLDKYQSAMLAATAAATQKPPEEATAYEMQKILDNVVRTTKDAYGLQFEEEPKKPQPAMKEKPKSQEQSKQRTTLKPKPAPAPVQEDNVDYASLETIRVWTMPIVVTLYFAAVLGSNICGLPVISGTIGIPLMLMGLPCMYYFYGSACYKNYSLAKQGAGLSIDRMSLIDRLRSKPYLIFGGSIAGGMLCGFIGGLNLLAHFSVWVVLIVGAIIIYFMTHFMCKDSIFDVATLSKEEASGIRKREDDKIEAKRKERKETKKQKALNSAMLNKRR